MSPHSEPVSIARDDIVLFGRFFPGRGVRQRSTFLLLPGSPGNRLDVLDLGENLSAKGYAVMTFNYSGTYDSGGLLSFENSQRDIQAAWRFLLKMQETEDLAGDLVLGGYSYGGGMALTYAANNTDVRSVFSVAGTDHGAFMREYAADDAYREMVDRIFAQAGEPASQTRLAPGATPREVFEVGGALEDYDLIRHAGSLTERRVLLVGGWDDLNVKVEHHVLPVYRRLKDLGASDATIRCFDDDHEFGESRDDLAMTIASWIGSKPRV